MALFPALKERRRLCLAYQHKPVWRSDNQQLNQSSPEAQNRRQLPPLCSKLPLQQKPIKASAREDRYPARYFRSSFETKRKCKTGPLQQSGNAAILAARRPRWTSDASGGRSARILADDVSRRWGGRRAGPRTDGDRSLLVNLTNAVHVRASVRACV